MSGSLRGCIGYIKGVKPMKETIEEMAISAAFRDPRFMSLTKDDYEEIDIEISILTPIVILKNIEDVKVGRDGLIITRGFQSGLLLPQVPVEQGWDRDTFIEHTCYKAGLPATAWNDPETKIETFSAQVFSEIELGLI
jgi:AmmeMemoRadiSam system protein A